MSVKDERLLKRVGGRNNAQSFAMSPFALVTCQGCVRWCPRNCQIHSRKSRMTPLSSPDDQLTRVRHATRCRLGAVLTVMAPTLAVSPALRAKACDAETECPGLERFGKFTNQPAPLPGEERSGYVALGLVDQMASRGDRDGRITRGDVVSRRLRLLRDANQNGRSRLAEPTTKPSRDVAIIGRDYRRSRRIDQDGNAFYYWARSHSQGGADLADGASTRSSGWPRRRYESLGHRLHEMRHRSDFVRGGDREDKWASRAGVDNRQLSARSGLGVSAARAHVAGG